MFTYALPVGERTACLYPEENAYTHTTAGTITAVRDAGHIPLYHHDGEFRGGILVTIDGVAYYSMSHPELREGASLHFTYCPEENLIMAFSPIEADEVSALQKPFVMPDPVPEEPVPPIQGAAGTLLTCMGWLGLIAYIFLIDKLAPQITAFLLKRDRAQRYEAVPNYAGIALMLLPLLPMAMIILGSVVTNGLIPALFILILGGGMMVLMSLLGRTWLRIEGRTIHFRRFCRTHTIPLSSLRAVSWGRSHKQLKQRCLILQFDDGTLRLNQEECLGLEDLHRRLSVYLSTNN